MSNTSGDRPHRSPEKAHESSSPFPPSGNASARCPLRILVVDDVKDAADSLAIYLRMHGYAARTAYDGQTALREASEFRPHAVLLDLAVPRLDGY
jgi:PleD family two-component response regulator